MNKTSSPPDKIELRSEKVRKTIGEIPRSLTRWGLCVIIIIALALFLAIFFIPYPYSDNETIFLHISEKCFNSVKQKI